jgi:cyclic pyranopterin monophosphate synthase
MSDQPVSAKHLTHLDEHGNVRMVDVTEKTETAREAIARAQVRMAPETVRLIETNQISKGSIKEVGLGSNTFNCVFLPLLCYLPYPHSHVYNSLQRFLLLRAMQTHH